MNMKINIKYKIFLLILLVGAFTTKIKAQCSISIDTVYYNGTGFITPDTIKICQGDAVTITSEGGCPTYMMNNDFNGGNVGLGWQSNTTPMFSNPCGAGINGSTYLWMGPSTAFSRELTTVGYDVTTSCQICFDMMYATQGNASPCEGPDEPTEGVHLQYSTVGATGPWFDINYWDPLGGTNPTLTSWNNYCESIPVNGHLWFRWFQEQPTDIDYDHWGLDNVQIFCPPPSQTVTWTANGTTISNIFNPPVQTPTVSTNYQVTVSDGTLSATDQVYIQVYPTPTLTINGLNSTYCSTAAASSLTGTPTPGVFSGPGITGTSFNPTTAGIGTHTITYHSYYITTNTSTGPQTIFNDNFSTNTGWTGYGAGGWTRGPAVASVACSISADPSTDHTTTADNYIIGNYLGACYPANMAQTYWLTSPIINCTNLNTCSIEFYSFSGCETPSWDHMYIDVSSNGGGSWTNVYSNTTSVAESTWTLRTYPTAQANNCANFKVRFGMGITDSSVEYAGWNIDDFKVKCNGTITVTDTLCDFTTTQNVQVFSQPTSTFSLVNNICQNSTTTFTYTGTSPATATYTWDFAGGTIISGSGQGPYVVNYATAGAQNITLTVSDGGCTSIVTTNILTVLPFGDPLCCIAPTSNAGANASICQLTYPLQAVASLGTGTWSQISGPGTSVFSNAALATSTVTVTAAGTYTFQWFENNGTNCTNFDQVDITFTQQPVANAGPDGQTCSLSFTMAAAISVGTGTWTQVSGPGTSTFVTPTSATSVVNVSVQGSYTYSWTENNNGCTNSDNVTINYAVQPVANAGADNSVCLLTYQLQAVPSVGVGTWTYTGPGIATFVNANVANTNVTVTLGGAYNFTWTENNGLGCVSSDIVVITFTQQPVANAGINISVCQLNMALQGVASVGTGTWTQQSGPGTITFTDANSPTTLVTASAQGIYSLLWTENNGNGCTSSDNMTATFTSQPIANAGSDNQICSQTISLLALPSIGTGTWFSLPGAGSAMFTNISSPNTSVTVSQYGTYNFVWNENNGNGCNDQDTVKIIFDYVPTSTFTLSQINCFGDNSNIIYTGNGVPAATYTWNFGPATIASGTGQGPYQINFATAAIFPISLQVSQNGCTSAITSLNITNPPLLTLSLTKNDVTCFGLDNGMVSTIVGGGTLPYSYLWSTGSVFSMVPSATAGTYILTVTDVNGCTKTNQITVLEPPQLAIDVPDYIAICNDSTLTITASATGGMFPYTLLWNTGGTSNTITVSPDTTTHYFVMATDANFCTSLTNIEVFVYPILKLTATQSADSICSGETVIITPTASGGKGEPYSYFINGSPTITPMILYPNTAQSYQIKVKDGCSYMAQVDVPVFVYPSPNLSPSADKIQGCTPLSVQFNESTPDQGQTYIWSFGDNQAAFTKNPMHIFKQPGTYTIGIIVTNIYGCKAEDPSLFTIEAYPIPEAQFEPIPAVASVIKPIISFNNYSTLATSVKWYFGDSDSSNVYNPVHYFPAYPPGIYDVTLIVLSDKQCSDTIMGKIEIKDEFTFYSPSAFSPDNDGKNDEFFVFGSNINPETFTLMVYDRWGEVIFKTNDIHEGWKGLVKGGEKAPVGNYSWICTFRDFKRILHEKTGAVTVIR